MRNTKLVIVIAQNGGSLFVGSQQIHLASLTTTLSDYVEQTMEPND